MTEATPQGLHVVAKPIGPACNLDFEYCFYLEKQALFAAGEQYRMPEDVLSAFIAGYISSAVLAARFSTEDLDWPGVVVGGRKASVGEQGPMGLKRVGIRSRPSTSSL